MGIIYIDRLSPLSLLAARRAGPDYSAIYYFDRSRPAARLTGFFLSLGLLKAAPEPLDFSLGQITDRNGESLAYKIVEDTTAICAAIETGELMKNKLVIGAGAKFDGRKVRLFFKKIIARDIEMPVIHLNAAAWHARRSGVERAHVIFANSLWFPYLADYARQLGLSLSLYGVRRKMGYFKGHIDRAKTALKRRLFGAKAAPLGLVAKARGMTDPTGIGRPAVEGNEPKLAALFAGRTVAFDLKKRSDFFWLLKSDILFEQVLIYLATPQLKFDRTMIDLVKEKNMSLAAVAKNCADPALVPVGPVSIGVRDYLRLALPSFWRAIARPRKNYFYFLGMLYFIAKYLQWSRFFQAHNIKVNLNPTDFMEAQIPMQQAIEDAGGVSVSYHWSNIDFSSMFMSNCADVLFTFSPVYRDVFARNGSVIDNFVDSGYITDYAFKEVKEDALELRRRLQSAGAKFILCFFDENSSNNPTSMITHEKTTRTYKYFLERVLEDESLGLIFKPGYPTSIYQRIEPVSELIEKAKATGRCVFIDEGTHVSEKYPSEAAQAADLSVGLLLSGTVALESYLSGTPTVFLDLENLRSNPIYGRGEGKVVFNSLDGLFSGIRDYRRDPERSDGFGDLSKWAEARDPFRDGQASLRIGQYLNWLLEEFNEGRTRNEAIAAANANYQREWRLTSQPVNSGSIGLDVKGDLSG